jgi:hypothetical protein
MRQQIAKAASCAVPTRRAFVTGPVVSDLATYGHIREKVANTRRWPVERNYVSTK